MLDSLLDRVVSPQKIKMIKIATVGLYVVIVLTDVCHIFNYEGMNEGRSMDAGRDNSMAKGCINFIIIFVQQQQSV